MATEYVEYNGQYTGEQIDSAIAKVGNLKTVATSGSYNDLTNKPTIPDAANNATLTIKKNGTAVGTFTANADTNVDINITVPTTASDVSALPSSTKYAGASTAGGAATSAAKLNTNAGSATQPVYFSGGVPVAGTYSLNATVPANAVFTDTTYESKSAASGGTAVSLVTTGEKYTWNGKQNALTFDDSPTSGSNNPVKSGGIYTALEGKVNTVSGKGLSTNDYTTAEKNKLGGLSGEDLFVLGDELASNSNLNDLTTPGCWRATTAAIATSISNIPADVTTAFFGVTIPSIAGSHYIQLLIPNDDAGVWYKRRYTGSWQAWVKYVSSEAVDDSVGAVANTGAKNLLKTTLESGSKNGITYTVSSDGTITLDIPSSHGTGTTEITVRANAAPPSTMLGKSLVLSGCPSGGSSTTFRMILQNTSSGYSTLATDEGSGATFAVSSNITQMRLMLMVYKDCPAMTVTIKPMIRDANIKDNTYEPYAPTNRELYEMILASST